jgi:hypothetical protein
MTTPVEGVLVSKPTPTTKARLAAAAALAGLMGLAGCSGSSTPAASLPKASRSASKTGAPITGVTLPQGVENASGVPTDVANSIQRRKNVQLTSCVKTTVGWQASGVASNPAASPTDYTITVFFTTATATVIGTGATQVHVDNGVSQTWTVTGNFPPAPSTLCVLRGVA